MTYPHPLFFYTRLTRTPPPSTQETPPFGVPYLLLLLRNYMLDFAKIGISDTYTCL